MDWIYFWITFLNKHNFIMRIINSEDLLQYLYNETSSDKSVAIKAALDTDWYLREAFEIMADGQKKLEDINLSPREDTLKKVLNYADKEIKQLHSH